jgi:hypothetical protein
MSQPTIFISVYAALGEEAGESCLIVTLHQIAFKLDLKIDAFNFYEIQYRF